MTSKMEETNKTALSVREQEILRLVATGLTNREIAQKLFISPNTVKVHLSNIFEKINVASRTEATLYGIEHGIVEIPGGEGSAVRAHLTWRDVFLKYIWIWIPVFILLVVFVVLISTGVIFKGQTAEPLAAADVAERWQELAPMPEYLTGMAAVAYDQDVFVIAGEGQEGVSGKVFHYSTAEDIWVKKQNKPTPVTDVQGALIGERVFIPGGSTAEGTPTDALEIYDPRQDAWETGASLPIALSAYALVDFEGQLYLFGGWDGAKVLDTVLIYDPMADLWREGSLMPAAWRDLGAVALEDRIIILGGRNGGDISDQTWAYYPSRDADGENPWDAFIRMPTGRFGFGAGNIYDTIYILGGQTDGKGADDGGQWIMTGEDWVDLPVNQDYNERDVALVPMGSQLFVLDPSDPLDGTKAWTYQAFYYSIYIPYVP